MKLLAMIPIDDLDARRFLDYFFRVYGQNVPLKHLQDAYGQKFGCKAAQAICTPQEWTEKKMDLMYVPIIVEFGKVKQLEAE